MPELKTDSDLGSGNKGITSSCCNASQARICAFPYNPQLDSRPCCRHDVHPAQASLQAPSTMDVALPNHRLQH